MQASEAPDNLLMTQLQKPEVGLKGAEYLHLNVVIQVV
ncbi:MAG: hypothetical protein RL648_1610 [Verrucomicrobiota bacterium]|jgi:hypothetical protein